MDNMRKKVRLTAYLLWIVLGGFGAHRFYLRQKKVGFILLIYTSVTILMDWLLGEYIEFFRSELFYWVTTIPLMIFLLIDVFKISGWVDNINEEERGAHVFD